MNKKSKNIGLEEVMNKKTQYKAIYGPVWGVGGRYAAQPLNLCGCERLKYETRPFRVVHTYVYSATYTSKSAKNKKYSVRQYC